MKKYVSVVMAAIMLICMVPTMALAESCSGSCTHAAAIGSDHYATLEAAITAAQSTTGDVRITLLKSISSENVIIKQKAGLNLTIDGANFEMSNSSIKIYGNSRLNGAETLTIKNILFDFDGAGAVIQSDSNVSAERYAHNVTIENCTFELDSGVEVYVVKVRYIYGLTLLNCTMTGGYDLVYNRGGSEDIVVDGATITGASNGVHFNNAKNCQLKNSNIEAASSGVLFKGGSGSSLIIENSTIKASYPVALMSGTPYSLNIEDENIALTDTDDDNPIYGIGNINLAGAIKAQIGNTYYTDKDKAISEAKPGDIVILFNDDGTKEEIIPVPAPAPTPAAPSGRDYSITYNGGNSFSTNKSAVPTSVEIDGQEVGFVGDGRNFTVNCIPADASRITVRWNSTSITVNFKPDATVQCTEVEIPKTGDMPLWAAVAAIFGF